MITLLKTGIDYLLAGNSVVGNANIIIKPMISSWFDGYTDTPVAGDHLYLDAGSNPIGYAVAVTTDYDGLETNSFNNRQRLLITAGIDTSTPSAVIDTTNGTSSSRWLLHDTVAGVDIGYVGLGNIAETAIASGTTLLLTDNVLGSMEVNNGISYPFADAIKSIYSGGVNALADSVELAIIKKTDDSDFTDDELTNSTNGQTITKLTGATGVTIVTSGIALTNPATVSTVQASLTAADQLIPLVGVSETNCTILLTIKDADNSILKLVAKNVTIDEYVILNFTDPQDDLVLL